MSDGSPAERRPGSGVGGVHRDPRPAQRRPAQAAARCSADRRRGPAHDPADRRRPARHPAREVPLRRRARLGARERLGLLGCDLQLDTGNGVFPPAFAAGGGFGIEEMTGFPDVTLVPDPTTFRVLPYANRTGWILSDAYFANGKPIPLDGRGLLRASRPPRRARAGALRRPRGRAVRDAARTRRSDSTRRAARPAGRGARGRGRSSAATSSSRTAAWTASPARWRRSATGSSTSACRRARSRTSGGRGRSRSRSARWRASPRPTR